MRKMVLNHASVLAQGVTLKSVTDWVVDLADGISGLVSNGVAQKRLWVDCHLYEIRCLPGYSLYKILTMLPPKYRDQENYLMGLMSKVALLREVSDDVWDRVVSCEEQQLGSPDGNPLVFCVIAEGIVIGLPTSSAWDHDTLVVRCNELLWNESIASFCVQIDQLTRSHHMGPIIDRYRSQLRERSDPTKLWSNRKTVFPNLVFGPDVEDNLEASSNVLRTIVGKLQKLNESAGEWQEKGGYAPPWRTHVTPESVEKMKNEKFKAKRIFRSYRGTMETFEWHARFGNNGRIHLRIEQESRKVEIGYIGSHLPL